MLLRNSEKKDGDVIDIKRKDKISHRGLFRCGQDEERQDRWSFQVLSYV